MSCPNIWEKLPWKKLLKNIRKRRLPPAGTPGLSRTAEVPLFEHFKAIFGFERNNYDKVGHFVQGFVPAMIGREILIRKGVVNGRGWLNFLVVCFCLAFSAFYELVEWWVATATGEGADAFLGTQGYVWDTQSDMGLALLGSVVALATLAKVHDRQLQRIEAR